MTDPLVLPEPGRVWTLTLNRPDARNAMSAAMIAELEAALGRAAADPDCRSVIIAGAGKDFCSGADVGELLAARETAGTIEYGRTFESLLRTIEHLPQPVIAAAQGAALGAGCQLLLACDLVVAAENARIGIPSARLGIVIPFENVERLVLAVGPKRAGEMLLAGVVLSGDKAEAWGLVNRAVPGDLVADAARELADIVASLAPLSVGASKRGIRAVVHESVNRITGGDLVAEFDALAASALASADLREGLAAFLERRAPEFEGR
jgi:enoyl-CoA hydratase/carnithine racemase